MRAMALRRARERLVLEERPDPDPGQGQIRSASRPAASAAPTCTSSTANCRSRSCRSCPGTRSSAASPRSGEGVDASRSASASALPGSATCGDLPLLPERAREPLRRAAVHRLTRDGGYATHRSPTRVCFPLPTTRRSGRDRAAAVRRPDRLALAQDGRRRRGRSASTASAPPPTSSRRSPLAGSRVFAFTRPGDVRGQAFARALGAAGPAAPTRRRRSRSTPPSSSRRSARSFRRRLRAVRKGGRVVCGGIHMSDIPSFPYRLLWGERSIVSVANLTRATARSSWRSRRGGVRTTTTPIRWSRPTRRSPTCAPAGSTAPRCSCPEASEHGCCADPDSAAKSSRTDSFRMLQ